MDELRFEWDSRKEKSNIKKHGVSFEEARTIFYDEKALQFSDPDHSVDEERFILLGMSFKLRTLVVCHCVRDHEHVIRIISARKADSNEQQEYWRSTS
ncbi:MAG: BrnT family toxin [Nitrospirae bacterium]|nr:BrnT family toxin [Nitrospirota bacterium]MDA1304437.1 BrnT family toxin [Nitrospirota bacterium]